MDLYYAPPRNVSTEEIVLEGEESAHLSRVMRGHPGQEILVADGEGMTYSATIVSTDRRRTVCRITARHGEHNEPSRQLTLAVGLTKNPSRFDILVEKATEIGVAAVVPLLTRRTIRQAPRTERWKAIALAAMKQSGRSRFPQIEEPATLPALLSRVRGGNGAILHEHATGPPLTVLGPTLGSTPLVLVGPEGGFTDEELREAIASGCRQASLGRRRLRTETAAVVAAALLLLGVSGTEGF